jgi:hypothetical protein
MLLRVDTPKVNIEPKIFIIIVHLNLLNILIWCKVLDIGRYTYTLAPKGLRSQKWFQAFSNNIFLKQNVNFVSYFFPTLN